MSMYWIRSMLSGANSSIVGSTRGPYRRNLGGRGGGGGGIES